MKPFIAIACGGTGGHLFPGVAVAEAMLQRNAEVTLLISPKEVDQAAVRSAGRGIRVETLPAIGLTGGNIIPFVRGFWTSLLKCKNLFRHRPPQAVLAMGGFTSAPPILAGKSCGAATFLHESNTIPGRANRWLAHVVDQAFVGFPSAAGRLHNPNVLTTGTPVRSTFQRHDEVSSRIALGLDGKRPVLLVMGGSQGASGINELVVQALPKLQQKLPEMQLLHLTGMAHYETIRNAYAEHSGIRAVVLPFLTEMEMALAAASVAITRAGASTMAELAATQAPSILVPFPHAADNHQYYNARAFVDAGAALLLEQRGATGEQLVALITKVWHDQALQISLREGLERWHAPHAADMIAGKILNLVQLVQPSSPSVTADEFVRRSDERAQMARV